MLRRCRKPEHQGKKMKFCTCCALNHKNVVFCKDCESQAFKQKNHSHYEQQCILSAKQFSKLIKQIAENVQQIMVSTLGMNSLQLKQSSEVRNDNSIYSRMLVNNVTLDNIDQDTLQQLIKLRFWQKKSIQQQQMFKSIIREDLRKKNSFKEIIDNPDFVKKQRQETSFKVILGQQDCQLDIQAAINQAQLEIQSLQNEQRKIQLYSNIYTSFEDAQLAKIQEECLLLKNKENSFLSKLALCKTYQLFKSGSEKLSQALKQFPQEKVKEKQLFYYFTAIKQWVECVDKQDIRFFQARNGICYKIKDSKAYISALTEAIALNEKPVYYSLRALGYIAQKQHLKALTDIQAAEKMNYISDCLTNNKNYCLKALDKIKDQQIMQSIEMKSTQFIINAAKRFNKQKKHQHLLKCCQILCKREPNNTDFAVQLIKAMIKVDAVNKREKIRYMFEDLWGQKRISDEQRDELEKRLTKQTAKFNDDKQQLRNQLQIIAQIGRVSANDYFMLAKYFYETQDYKKCVQYINKAIELKPQNRYYKIKLYALFYSYQFQKVRKLIPMIKDSDEELFYFNQYLQNFV